MGNGEVSTMRYRKEVKEAILRMLAAKLDERLARHGFKRNPRSLEYRRTVPGAKQVIWMDFESHPSSDPRADAYVYPWTFAELPVVENLALEMVGNPDLLENCRHKTLGQPAEWAAPKGQRTQWYLTGEDAIMNAGDSMGDYIERWVIPSLDAFSSPEGLVRAFESNDERTGFHYVSVVFVAAAYLLLGNPEAALRALDQKLVQPHLRERYAKAFDFVRRKLAEGGQLTAR